MAVNWISLGFDPLVGHKKTFEDAILEIQFALFTVLYSFYKQNVKSMNQENKSSD